MARKGPTSHVPRGAPLLRNVRTRSRPPGDECVRRIPMNNFCALITPAKAKLGGDERSLEELLILASIDERLCDGCRRDSAWRYAGTGLCFTCTTGETDASCDFELLFLPLAVLHADAPTHAPSASEGSDRWMEEQGFVWETFEVGYPRWKHRRTGITARRSPEMTNAQWIQYKIDRGEQARRAPVRARASGNRTRSASAEHNVMPSCVAYA
jgi:hypothetical protein